MSKVDDDILYTDFMIKARLFGSGIGDEGKIYYSSNEKIDMMIKHIDINNKKVLSVLGSGDQAFHLYNNGASIVEVFDMNKLTIYYYYLRRWVIIYMNSYYPDFNNFSIEYIKNVLLKVNPKTSNEANALNYWNLFVSKFTNPDLKKLFHFPIRDELDNNYISNLELLRKKIENDTFLFYNKDFSRNIDIDDKYDLIYISNIPEWIYHMQGGIHLEILKSNLLKLLNNDGIVLGTNVTLHEPSDSMRKIFRNDFYLQYIMDSNEAIGYQYRKIK